MSEKKQHLSVIMKIVFISWTETWFQSTGAHTARLDYGLFLLGG